jgi:hypothetical protein
MTSWAGGFKLHLPMVDPENCGQRSRPGDRHSSFADNDWTEQRVETGFNRGFSKRATTID